MAFSSVTAAFEGFRLIRREPAIFVIWCVAALVFFSGLLTLIWPMFIDLLSSSREIPDPDAAQAQALFGRFAGIFAIAFCLFMLGTAVLQNAIARAVLRPQDRGFAYMRLGMDELRFIGFGLLLILLWWLLVMAVGAVVLIGSMLPLHIAIKILLGVLLFIAVLVFAIWAALRLTLAWPIVVAERRIDVNRSWRLTRGRVLPLLGMVFLVVVISFAIQMVFDTVNQLALAPVWTQMLAADEPDLAFMTSWAANHWPLLALVMVVGTLVLVIQTILSAAAYARAYKDLVEEKEGAEAQAAP